MKYPWFLFYDKSLFGFLVIWTLGLWILKTFCHQLQIFSKYFLEAWLAKEVLTILVLAPLLTTCVQEQ